MLEYFPYTGHFLRNNTAVLITLVQYYKSLLKACLTSDKRMRSCGWLHCVGFPQNTSGRKITMATISYGLDLKFRTFTDDKSKLRTVDHTSTCRCLMIGHYFLQVAHRKMRHSWKLISFYWILFPTEHT